MAVQTQQDAINYLVKKYPFMKDWNFSISSLCRKDVLSDELKWNFDISVIDSNDANVSFQSKSEEDITGAVRDIDQQLKVLALLRESEVKIKI